MRSLCNYFIFLTSLLYTTNIIAQEEVTFTAQFHEEPIQHVFKEIEKTFNVYISYSEKTLKEHKVTASIQKANLYTTLTQTLAGSSLVFEEVDDKFIVIKTKVYAKIELEGRVTDENNEPLPYAFIKIKNTGLASDTEGRYHIVAFENDSLTFSYLGYYPQTLSIQKVLDKKGGIKLYRNTQELPELVYEKQLNEISQVNQVAGMGKEVKNSGIGNLSTAENDNLYYAVKLLPSVSNTGFSSALEVRGGEEDQNLTLVDKFPMYQLDHYFGLENVINPDLTNSATFYAGGFNSQYGSRISSILDIRLKNPPLDYVEGNVGVSLLGYKGYLSLPIVKGKLAVLGSYRKYHGAIEKWLYDRAKSTDIENSDYNPDQLALYQQQLSPEIDYHDANAKMVYQMSESDELSFSFLNSRDNYYTSYDLRPRRLNRLKFTNSDERFWKNNAFTLEWKKEKENFTSSVYSSYSENERYRKKIFHVRDTTRVLPQQRTLETYQKLKDFSIHSDQSIKFNKGVFDFGAVYSSFNVQKELKPESYFSYYVDSTHQSHQLGIYSQYTFNLKRLKLTAGGRLWYYQPTAKPYFAPRLQGELALDPQNKYAFTFSMGRYYQFIRELSDELTYDSYWIISDGNRIPVINANHFIGGFKARQKSHTFNIEGYLKNSDGEMSDLAFRNVVFFRDYIGTGQSYGVDMIYEYNHKNWYNYISYGYNQYVKTYTEREQEKKTTHLVQLASVYTNKHWKIGLTWLLRDVNYDINSLLASRSSNTDNPSTYSPYDVPLYHRLDFTSSYGFRLGKRSKGEIVFTVYDLYNQKNTEERQITSLGSDSLEFILTDISQLGILPNLSFNLIF
ncbi:TonB-dependent receptor [Flammeovirga yaeyamensis]|uniref:TonB-dependent receptor n=1 Tax=Flammeovirga yaeyamensis TaxID=367791 RepID=A0AAX1N6L1_9BACT|nr:carboxypeptidase-like regulatory domain-containing protein [Flammeovirga yaeyamensis]MBB3701191.1 hypothetical protein [Flammeovirga yaeyamensis]NMF38483.1 TonB-dependent receptor plug domain-containing protein [Flammeovirga yaeyamensis]QWG01657.1 TonB-dependent receptor [Flammeovirga yaeyamensis]